MDSRDPVCLIIPPSAFLLNERVFVNLGILKIAAVLESSNYHIEILDLSGIDNFRYVLKRYLSNNSIHIFGITATTPQMPHIVEIASVIKTLRPDSKIILGGPHVTLVHTAAKKEICNNVFGRARKELQLLEKEFDTIVSGDGEKAIFSALKPSAPKIIDANQKDSVNFLSNEEFDKSPLPARHFVDLKSYHYTIDGVAATSLIGQLGCPFSCGFCGGRESPCLRIVRMRSVQSIIDEIKSIYETYNYTGFMFYDDELNVNPHFIELLEALTKLKKYYDVQFRFRGFVKSELFNESQAQNMYRAGFRWILSGFESGSPRILKNIHKRATVEDNTRCINLAHKNQLKVKALMSIGHPGESYETIRLTKMWLLENHPDDLDVTIIAPYPGTSYYDQAIENKEKNLWIYTVPESGDKLYCKEVVYNNTAVYYKGDPANKANIFTFTDYLSSDELIRLRKSIEEEVRSHLKLSFDNSKISLHYDHSMGQGSYLPDFLVRSNLKEVLA